jgi:Fic family protein
MMKDKKPVFSHYRLEMVTPSFEDPLTDLILGLDRLRTAPLKITAPPEIFEQIKFLFQTLESVTSARIEGNNTTLAEYMEDAKIDPSPSPDEQLREISNLESAMGFVEDVFADKNPAPINRAFVSDLHRIAVAGLSREGDKTPGEYRRGNVVIKGAAHLPPEGARVPDYMEELLQFATKQDEPKRDLLRAALAHHRFCWTHPFGNGNGRVARLLTYALLVKRGFLRGRALHPAAIFCRDRDKYYNMLAAADTGKREALLEWCRYVLRGLDEELRKMERLADYDYLTSRILSPAIRYCLQRDYITPKQAEILAVSLKTPRFRSAHIAHLFPGKSASQRARQTAPLLAKKMIVPIAENKRQYRINFISSPLARGVIDALRKKGFIDEDL